MSLRRMIRWITRDRARDPPELQEVLTVEQIGPRQSLTPEGFLLCESVPIARIGVMMYGPGEVPIAVGTDGVAWVSRTAEELFRPETLASFTGKPVVDEHPTDDVTPANWAKLARGVAFNIRQGADEDADVILADLLITDASMIRDIQAMKREVSAGYEADYEQTGEGQGVQTNIIGNHIALVDKGRCGPRCAIGDRSFTQRKLKMATQAVKKPADPKPPRRTKISQATLDALLEELSNPDASTMDDGELTGPADSHTHIHIHGLGSTAPKAQGAGGVDVKDEEPTKAADPNEARFAALENGHKEILAQLATITAAISGNSGSTGDCKSGMTDDENPFEAKKEDDKEEKGKTNDSAALETSYKDVLSGCEVLVPGFRMPTFDAAATRATTIDTMCGARRKALDAFSTTAEGQQVLESVSGVKTLDMANLQCPQVATLFRAAVGAKRLLNNNAATKDANRMGAQSDLKPVTTLTLAEINKRNREHYAKQR